MATFLPHVPDRVTSKTSDFRVVAIAPRQGSLELQQAIVLTGSLIGFAHLLKPIFDGILEEAGKEFYKIVLRRHIAAWCKRFAEREGLAHEETDLTRRIEPQLPWPNARTIRSDPDGSVFDAHAANGSSRDPAAAYRRLLGRTDSGMTMAAGPAGRDGGSSNLEIHIDGEFAGYIGERHPTDDSQSHDDAIRRIANEIERMRHQRR